MSEHIGRMYKYTSKGLVYATPILYQIDLTMIIDELDCDMAPERLESCKLDLDQAFGNAPFYKYIHGRCSRGVYLKEIFRDEEIWF